MPDTGSGPALFNVLAERKCRMNSQGCLGSHGTLIEAKSPPGQDTQNVFFREILSSIIKIELA